MAVYVYWLIAGALKHPGRTDITYTPPTATLDAVLPFTI